MTASLEPKTIGEAISRTAAVATESVAVISSVYEPLSYRQLTAQVDHFAATFRSAGFSCASRVAIALKDAPQAGLAIVSVACSAVAVPLDPDLRTFEIESRLRLLKLDALIVLAGEDSPIRDAAQRHAIPVIEAFPTTELGLRLSLVTRESPPPPSKEQELDAPAFILHTSGTTAEPNLIPFSHPNVLAAAARVKRWFNLSGHDRCLSLSPVYYCHGLTLTVLAPLLSGGSVAFPESPSRIDLGEWFGALEPSWLSASPVMHRAILEKAQLNENKRIRHSLRFVVSGGAPLPPEIQGGLQSALDVPILEHYGATEVAQVSANLPPPGPAKGGTCGIPDPDTVRIVGEDGAPLLPGARGEVLVGGSSVMSGYLNAPELNRVAFIDGWFRTGDIGSIDEQGFLTLHGRLKEVINRGGEKVSPMEIDLALLSHPDVTEAAAFAVPHLRLGEDVAAAVVLRPGATATPDELRRFLGTQLAWFKVPRRITIMEQLPKGNTGKVLRRRLSERVAGDH